jgi:hypothetical protein
MPATDYRIVVTRTDPNPEWDEEKAKEAAQQRARGYYNVAYTVPLIVETKVLEVILTPEEYQRMKLAIIEGHGR